VTNPLGKGYAKFHCNYKLPFFGTHMQCIKHFSDQKVLKENLSRTKQLLIQAPSLSSHQSLKSFFSIIYSISNALTNLFANILPFL
jgi:hypothetical protein